MVGNWGGWNRDNSLRSCHPRPASGEQAPRPSGGAIEPRAIRRRGSSETYSAATKRKKDRDKAALRPVAFALPPISELSALCGERSNPVFCAKAQNTVVRILYSAANAKKGHPFGCPCVGCGIGIRTPTNRVRVCRAAVTQFRNVPSSDGGFYYSKEKCVCQEAFEDFSAKFSFFLF